MHIGWYDDLYVIGCKINTRTKYFGLIILLGLLETIDIYVNDIIFHYIDSNREDIVKNKKIIKLTITKLYQMI